MRPRETKHIRALRRGETISFRVLGDDLPYLEGKRVTLEPAKPGAVKIGDLVLCVLDGAQCLRVVTDRTLNGCKLGRTLNSSSAFVSHDYVYGRSV